MLLAECDDMVDALATDGSWWQEHGAAHAGGPRAQQAGKLETRALFAGSQGGTVAPAGGNTCAPRSVRLDLKAPVVPRPDTDHTGPRSPALSFSASLVIFVAYSVAPSPSARGLKAAANARSGVGQLRMEQHLPRPTAPSWREDDGLGNRQGRLTGAQGDQRAEQCEDFLCVNRTLI